MGTGVQEYRAVQQQQQQEQLLPRAYLGRSVGECTTAASPQILYNLPVGGQQISGDAAHPDRCAASAAAAFRRAAAAITELYQAAACKPWPPAAVARPESAAVPEPHPGQHPGSIQP